MLEHQNRIRVSKNLIWLTKKNTTMTLMQIFFFYIKKKHVSQKLCKLLQEFFSKHLVMKVIDHLKKLVKSQLFQQSFNSLIWRVFSITFWAQKNIFQNLRSNLLIAFPDGKSPSGTLNRPSITTHDHELWFHHIQTIIWKKIVF